MPNETCACENAAGRIKTASRARNLRCLMIRPLSKAPGCRWRRTDGRTADRLPNLILTTISGKSCARGHIPGQRFLFGALTYLYIALNIILFWKTKSLKHGGKEDTEERTAETRVIGKSKTF